ncbi:GNAT family N-acetyltransferase [Actinomadura kijaniata]|uniref:GNAT family N-acetyltransferase n=1 Tax=Actinomadura kijaniata TaxID=46161 RepID=UPI000833B5EF|nr:GNAT family N-acetyltransferase [Actinomadura kijaniata]
MEIRRGGDADAAVVLGMLDGAVEWLVADGRSGQWGERPWSEDPTKVERITALVGRDEVWVAEVGGRAAGVVALAAGPHDYVEPAGEPEVYVTLLVTDRAFKGHGVGGALLRHAVERARERGVSLVRVDCYAGGDGRLVEYYRRNGFEPVRRFRVGEWPGQLLARRVTG